MSFCRLTSADGPNLVDDLLADRLCLAPSERVDTAVLTADASWGIAGRIRQIG